VKKAWAVPSGSPTSKIGWGGIEVLLSAFSMKALKELSQEHNRFSIPATLFSELFPELSKET
jgi:hypothetical protein